MNLNPLDPLFPPIDSHGYNPGSYWRTHDFHGSSSKRRDHQQQRAFSLYAILNAVLDGDLNEP